jgi:putative ABC transport system substrate-binding protein
MTPPRSWALIVLLSLGFLATPLAAGAQQASKQARIVVMGNVPLPVYENFKQRLRELGWTEGQNITIEYRWAEGKLDRLPDLAGEVVRLKPDLIVAITHRVALAAEHATTTIPVVFAQVNDPVGVGLVPSLAHPGGNVTGLSLLGLDLIGRRLALLKELVPSASRIAYLRNPDEPYSPAYLREVQRAAHVLGMKEVFSAEVRRSSEFDGAFASIMKQRLDAMMVEPNALTLAHSVRIAELAAEHRLPAMYADRRFTEAGCLMSYGPFLPAHFRRLADYVDKILKGAKPSDLPVEQPTTFELLINLKTAKALKLTIPQSLLLQADEIIE